MKKFPIGVQDFEKVQKGGFIYVDKTKHIFNLAQNGSYYFLGRPRRFGKSLLLSTLKAYFLGKKELFTGLDIDRLETEWKTYPVLYLDINSGDYKVPGELDKVLNDNLVRWEKIYGAEDSESTLALRFMGVIRRATEQCGEKAVILVDEYDKPMVQTINDDVLQATHRDTLKAFYSVLKTCDQYIRFAMLTGVTKFSKVSVFSDLNNLNDISMDESYIDICGISETELKEYFDDCVSELALATKMSVPECYAELKRRYDGYHFEHDTIGMYNPFSLLMTLSKKKFGNYWFETGTPSILAQLLDKSDYDLKEMTKIPVSSDQLNGLERISVNPVPIIYQSGYLTIKDYDAEMELYYLDYPNAEVKSGFLRFLMPTFTPAKKGEGPYFIGKFKDDILSGNPEGFIERLKTFFDSGDYRIQGKMELYFQNSLYVIFKLLGLYVDVEIATAKGRMDLRIKTSEYIYIIKLKLDGTAEEALSQIQTKGYALKFAQDTRKIFKVGINFSSETASIEKFLIA